jgi:DtxR family Mn-dependent transcriptional regulator
MERAACQVEHVVKKGIEEKICALLGHPETCPHGKAIPPGKCCLKAKITKEKFVVPLTCLKKGAQGVIAYIKTEESKKLQKLMAMGVLPGDEIFLDLHYPSFVFSVGYSQYAVDSDMAETIYVRKGKGKETMNKIARTS